MDLTMEGRKVLPQPGQSLLELVKQLGLDGNTLTERPLAAKIAGEVFTLNYIPVRQKEAEADRQSMRRAMTASNGEIRLLRYADPAGKECYIRTAQFTIFLAMRQLWPEATAKMTCTLGSSVYISVAGAKDFSASTLKARVSELVGQDIPLIRRRVKLQKAIDRFREYYRVTGWLENEPYPGVRECLQALQGAGKRMYVATSKLETMARQVLAHFDLLQYFAGVCGGSAEDPEAGKKVNVVRRVLRENGTDDLSRAVLSGDREYDILGGHQAGVQTVGVLYGYGSRAELTTAGADFLAASPEELQSLLLG